MANVSASVEQLLAKIGEQTMIIEALQRQISEMNVTCGNYESRVNDLEDKIRTLESANG